MTEQLKDKVEDLELDKKGDEVAEGVETKKDYSEDINAIFSGEELSEEFKTHAKAIFEAAVASKVTEIEKSLQEGFEQKLEEQVQEIASGIVDKVDEYLEYVVTEWSNENKVAIEKNLKAEIAEDFMVGLKNLFVENYIDIPEDKVDLVAEITGKLEQAEKDLDAKITEQADLVKQLNDYKKEQAVREVTEGLSQVQVEKLKSLAENIEFVSEEDYKEKLSLTKKKYFESKEEDASTVSESAKDLDSAESELDESLSPIMEHYVKNLSKFVKR